ncbi:sensor histidine kinase [Hoeflea alexandrii]|uniref:HWE histidine kinase domain-containing protein n=1 Tax=Hoeflea alexandrii TaxID=288436 RepID=UPI0035D080A1
MTSGKRFPSAITVDAYFFILVAVFAAPIVAFAFLLLSQLQQDNDAALERRNVRDARALAISVERQLQDIKTTLHLLATAPELRNGDFQAFHERTKAALEGSGYFVLLLQADGEQLLNTRVQFGADLPKTSDLNALQTSLKSDDIYISDIFFGRVSQKWVFNVMLPLSFEIRSQRAVLLITKNAEDMSDTVVTEGLPADWSSAIVDGSGNVVATTYHQNAESGKPFAYESRFPSAVSAGQVVIDGTLVAFAPLRNSTWRAVVWGPLKSARVSVFDNQLPLLLSGGFLLTLAGLLAVALGRKLRVSIEVLADEAKKMGGGDVAAYVKTPIKELNDVSVALTNSSFDRSQAEERLRVLVSEMSHRTKNMMTVINVMIRQTARNFDVPKEYLQSLQGRLQGLATSIDLLARDKWSGVPFKELLHGQLDKFADTPGQIEFSGEDFVVRPEAVQPISLAIHELGTNAMKYGALSVLQGKVRIEWSIDRKSQPSSLQLIWRESDGPVVKEPEKKGFGSVIIGDHLSSSLTSRAQALYSKDGFQWELTGPFSAFCDEPMNET